MAICQSTTKSGSTQSFPDFVTKNAKGALKDIGGFSSRPAAAYGGERVAPMTGDQNSALGMIRQYVSGGMPDVTDEALNMMRSGANTKSVDNVDAYFNPYIDRVLQPALRRIQEQYGITRRRLGDEAQTAGAYGDERHGILERDLSGEAMTASGDVAGRAYADAWNQAIANSRADLERKMTGAGGLMSTVAADQAQKFGAYNQLFQGGEAQRQLSQAGLDAAYDQWLRKRDEKFDKYALWVSALQGIPFERSTTSTVTQPDNSLANIFGTAAGAAPFLL